MGLPIDKAVLTETMAFCSEMKLRMFNTLLSETSSFVLSPRYPYRS